MKTFRQFVEALSNHGGFMMPAGEENFPKHNFSEKRYQVYYWYV